MVDPAMAIADKFSELITRRNQDGSMKHFNRTERAIYLLVSIRCEIDMEGFDSVFDQCVSRGELEESIGYLVELGLDEIAKSFQQILQLLDRSDYYDAKGNANKAVISLPEAELKAVEQLFDKIQENDVLWSIDPKLYQMLMSG